MFLQCVFSNANSSIDFVLTCLTTRPLLANSGEFSDQQDSALADYLQASVMLQ